MERFTSDDLRQLADDCTEQCLSVFLPTHRAGKDTRQDPIRLRNLLDYGGDLLINAGLKHDAADDRLREARALLDDPSFWQQQYDGLALFIGPNVMRRFRVPITLPEQVAIGPHFHVLPLLPLLDESGQFYILAASGGLVRLLEATEGSVREVEVKELPRDISELMKFVDDAEQHQQWHTQTQRAPVGGGDRPAMFHGQGAAGNQTEDKIRLSELATLIDRAITNHMGASRTPMVLAAAEPLASIYHEVNTYQGLIDETVSGNTDHMSPPQIRDRAWPLVKPHMGAQRDKAMNWYEEAGKTGVRTDRLEEVIPAAFQGRIHTLMVTCDDHVWGRFDQAKQKIEVHQREHPGDEDLVNLAAVLTAKSGGAVHAVDPQQMPERRQVMALFRYGGPVTEPPTPA